MNRGNKSPTFVTLQEILANLNPETSEAIVGTFYKT